MFKKTLATAVILCSSAAANAEVTANIGFMSDYFYRGIEQAKSVASAGIDYSHETGFYVGAWSADVDDGLEVDGYFGYGGEFKDVSYGVGYTGYFYTGDFDDTYQEINFSAGYGPISLEYNIGEYDNFKGPKLDYSFSAITGEYKGFYAKYGVFGEDFEGDYIEAGYGTTLHEIDVTLSVIAGDKDLSATGDDEQSMVLSVAKTFSL